MSPPNWGEFGGRLGGDRYFAPHPFPRARHASVRRPPMADYDPHCRLCGRSPSVGPPPAHANDPQFDWSLPWSTSVGEVWVKLPGGGETQVATTCRSCYHTTKYLRSVQPVPFAIYYEQVDASGRLDWKNCAMCGDRAYSATAWCWRCAPAMQHPSAKERQEQRAPEYREWQQGRRDRPVSDAEYLFHLPREAPSNLVGVNAAVFANSVGALQVLPGSAADVRPSASFYDPNPSLRPNQYEWTQALTNLYLHL